MSTSTVLLLSFKSVPTKNFSLCHLFGRAKRALSLYPREGSTGLERRILAIHGHLARGYAGTTVAAFPLQTLGFDVDSLVTAQFSNHFSYQEVKGTIMSGADLAEITDGLRANNLLHYTHLLTGYVGSASFLDQVHKLVLELRAKNKDLVYLCDPIMGDHGQWYSQSPRDLLPIYRDKLLPLADIITPNQYETELLSELPVKTEEDAHKAIDQLLAMGPKTVVISSMECETRPGVLVLLAKTKNGERVRIEIPKVPENFVGTGDLFSALLLAWSITSNETLQSACEKAVCTMNSVLRRTLTHALKLSSGEIPTPEQKELRLVQSKRDIENPPSISTLFSSTN